MNWKATLTQATKRLPVLGIVAFSLCSTHSLYQLFMGHARHPTELYWLPAILTELVTAWAVTQIVQGVRELTRSRISKQDRRFYWLITGAFALISTPLLAASLWANRQELSSRLLGALFPTASIGCAIGAALPDVVARFQQGRTKEKADQQEEKERLLAEKEKERQRLAIQGQLAESLGKALATVRYFEGNPTATHGQAAEALGISRRTVGNHLARAESAGVIQRNNGSGVEILTW